MKGIQIITCVALFCAATQSNAQEVNETLTLSQAIERAYANYPLLDIQRYAVEQARGTRKTAGLLPNPVVTFYIENLSLNGRDGGERTLYAGLPLNFLWSRSPQVSSAAAQVQAEQLRLTDVKRLLKFEVQKAFTETHFAAEAYLVWQKVAEVFLQAAEDSQVRFTDGDISGYEQQRINVEYLRYQKAKTEAKVRLNNSQKQLAFLLDPDQTETFFQTSAALPSSAPDLSLENLLNQSIQNRPDLQATHSMVQSRQEALNASKLARIPEISVAAGYKRQVDDFKGSVVQISLGVPLFNRNQGKVHTAYAELNQEKLRAELLRKRVALEVRQAFETYRLYYLQVKQFQEEGIQPPEQLLEVARLSYAEGEMSLLELLDGVRAYSESFQTKNELLLNYQLSIFELEKATGTSMAVF